MSEVLHEPGSEGAINAAPDPQCGGPELRAVRRRRRPAKKNTTIGAEPRTPAARDETALTTVASKPTAMPTFRSAYRAALSSAQRMLGWLRARREWQRKSRRLSLCETISLGEKRFVAIVQVDDQHFLLGGASTSVSMLAQLNPQDNFAAVLQQRRKRGGAVA
jgi:Flagellar biosynthesis protein, FliO